MLKCLYLLLVQTLCHAILACHFVGMFKYSPRKITSYLGKTAYMMISERDNASNYLPSNLKTLRKLCCLSQEELGSHLGLNRGNISSYESGCAEPKLCNLMKISAFFNLTMGDITMQEITCKDHYEKLIGRINEIKSPKIELIEKVESEIKHFSKLIDSSSTCFHHFAGQIKESDSSLHAKYLFHYEQMQQITQNLLLKYTELIEKCQK